jgi:hypothetical protein
MLRLIIDPTTDEHSHRLRGNSTESIQKPQARYSGLYIWFIPLLTHNRLKILKQANYQHPLQHTKAYLRYDA